MNTFNIYIKNLSGALVILNWRARSVREKSRAVYRHSVACTVQALDVVHSQTWASKISDRHLTPAEKCAETQVQWVRPLPPTQLFCNKVGKFAALLKWLLTHILQG